MTVQIVHCRQEGTLTCFTKDGSPPQQLKTSMYQSQPKQRKPFELVRNTLGLSLMVFVVCVSECGDLTCPDKRYFPSCVLSIGRSSITSSSIPSTRNLIGEREREGEILHLYSAVPSRYHVSIQITQHSLMCMTSYYKHPLSVYHTIPLSVCHT